MVDKQQFFLPCFVVCAIFSAIISAQSPIRVDTDPSQIVVTENQRNVSLMCRVGRPIQFCTFTLPSSSQQVALTPGQPGTNGLEYFGEGWQKGQCGVTIDRITTAHNGQVKCSVFVDGVSVEGLIDVVVAVPPSQPTIQLEPETTYFEAGKAITAHCVTTGGNPDPQLTWFLENDPIYEGVDKQQAFEQDGVTGTALTLRRIINGNDNGKRLICQATHRGYPEGSSQTSLQLAVSFPPLYLPEQTIHGLTLGRTVDVTLVIEANPKPRTHWTVDGVGIEEGSEHDRFAARMPEQLDTGAYNVTLTIAGLTLEDLTKKYTLRASNDFGVQDYTVMLSSLDAEVDESGGVGIGGIIGIVLAALIVLAAIALILVARATGRWCFRGKSTSTSTSNARIGETSDTESADLKQPITKTQRLKILFGRKRAEATGEIADNELAGAGAPEDYGVDPTAEGKRPATSTTTKEEPTIVYAELELKPSEHSYVAKPESTEYAEILYVQKPGDSNGNDGARIPVVVTGGSSAADSTPTTGDGERPAPAAPSSTTTTTTASSEKK